jgi:2-polyprenyl-3-methyl-5-hydroxy-6-metoxy-1,4-benzoquinol methylase
VITPTGTELLDDPGADPAAVRTSLTNIARANRLFGGTAAVCFGVDRLLSAAPSIPRIRSGQAQHPALSLLDLGTGAGDIPAALRPWGAARGTTIRTFGLERLRPAARMAGTSELPVALGCVTALPFRTASVDVVTMSQVLHHFDRETSIAVLREAARVARLGVVVADLIRSRVAAALFGVGALALGFDRHTRTDGVTSVRRGYRPLEVLELFHAAGLSAGLATRPAWRVVAWGTPS